MKVRKLLSADSLKLIAIAAMLTDHIAWLFVPTQTAAGQLLHMVGRITVVVMSFSIAEGYIHTKNLGRYAARLFVFAVLSEIPYNFYKTGTLMYGGYNVIFTLFLALAAVWVYDTPVIKSKLLKLLAIALLLFLSDKCDWSFVPIALATGFFAIRKHGKRAGASLAMVALVTCVYLVYKFVDGRYAESILRGIDALKTLKAFIKPRIMTTGLLLGGGLTLLYNGKPGKYRKQLKWLFYIFYPLHLVAVRAIYELI